LCALHHAAYDRGLLAVDQNYVIKKNKKLVERLKDGGLDAGLAKFLKSARIGRKIFLPADAKYHPDRESLKLNLAGKGAANFGV
jgi:putative restriction endonuclease